MVNINDMGSPMIANKAFVPLAIEAGIETVITSLVPLATTERELVVKVVDALETTNPELAAAWNIETQRAVLQFLDKKAKTPFSLVKDLPDTVNMNGPASVSAARDGGAPTQVNVTFSGQPEEHRYGIYLDGVFQKAGLNQPVDGFTSDYISDVPVDGAEHTIRVLYITPDLEITLFGQIATFA